MAILGLKSLQRKLKRLPELAREEIAKAMEQGANEIVALAKSLVAVDEGDLRNSIGWTWGDAPDGAMVIGTVRGGRGAGNLRITIFAGNDEVFWGRWQEFGTQKMPAHPFFFVSYRALRKRSKSRITRAINKSAKRAAAGG